MTPERWRRIGELFDAAVRIDPAGREVWLRAACGGDDDLRAEVGRLLDQDERADRDGILTPPEPNGPPPDRTASWHARDGLPPSRKPGPIADVADTSVDDSRGLHPQAGDRHRQPATADLRAPIGRAGAAPRAADHLYPHAGIAIFCEAHRPRERGHDALPIRRRDHRWPLWA